MRDFVSHYTATMAVEREMNNDMPTRNSLRASAFELLEKDEQLKREADEWISNHDSEKRISPAQEVNHMKADIAKEIR